jgi:hypothetical protein
MKLLESGVWVRVRHYFLLGSPMLASRIATTLHSLPSSTTLRHFFPLCALIVDSFANMSSGIVLKMENICGNTEQREGFLWWWQRKPQLLGDAEESSHSASLCVAEKIPKCIVTVNIRGEFFLLHVPRALSLGSIRSRCVQRRGENRSQRQRRPLDGGRYNFNC